MIYPTRKVRAIVRREYLVRVRNRWFLITTFGVPLLMLAFALVPAWLAASSGDGEPLRVGVVDRAGVTTEALNAGLDAESAGIELIATEMDPDATPGEMRNALRISDLDAYLLLPAGVRRGESATLLSRASVGQARRGALRTAVREAVVRADLREAGVAEDGADRIFRGTTVGLGVVRVDAEGQRSQELLAGVTMGLIFILYTMFMVYGQMIVRGVLEEKTSDIAEILVSSVRPWELMLGKILGIGAVGLTQLAIWGLVGAGLVGYGLAVSGPLLAEAGLDLSTISFPVATVGGAFLVFFVLGYLLYASGFAAVGAIIGDEGETQQVTLPYMLLIIVPFLLAFAGLGNPGAEWLRMASLFPFFTPILMVLRITMGVAAAWEVVTSLVLLVLTTGVLAWLAGRIYRVGILMKGKRPSLPEVLRWVRHG